MHFLDNISKNMQNNAQKVHHKEQNMRAVLRFLADVCMQYHVSYQEVRRHLSAEFGQVQECGICEMVYPPLNKWFEVIEPLETCHPTTGLNPLPVGRYRIVQVSEGVASHFAQLEDFNGENIFTMIAIGYTGASMIDWRGVRVFNGGAR